MPRIHAFSQHHKHKQLQSIKEHIYLSMVIFHDLSNNTHHIFECICVRCAYAHLWLSMSSHQNIIKSVSITHSFFCVFNRKNGKIEPNHINTKPLECFVTSFFHYSTLTLSLYCCKALNALTFPVCL